MHSPLGVNAGTFRGANVGCLGGVLLGLLTAAGFLGLLAMLWWYVLGPGGPPAEGGPPPSAQTTR